MSPARRHGPAELLDLVHAERSALGRWLTGADPAAAFWSAATDLTGWSVRDLAAHLVLVASSIRGVREAEPGDVPLGVPDYLATYAAGADGIATATRSVAGDSADLARQYDADWAAAELHVRGLLGQPVVRARRGPIRPADFLATRLLELVVHGDDLRRTVPADLAPPPAGRAAQRVVVRLLLDTLAARAPGRSVEVRVPPYAAVQCIRGPGHTRGTPPNVVETDPTTWIRLAAGRTTWADELAADHVVASGSRADLAGHLPLL